MICHLTPQFFIAAWTLPSANPCWLELYACRLLLLGDSHPCLEHGSRYRTNDLDGPFRQIAICCAGAAVTLAMALSG